MTPMEMAAQQGIAGLAGQGLPSEFQMGSAAGAA